MQLTMRDAIRLALRDEMREDDSVVFFGEDVAAAGGVFKVTPGLLEEFGPLRVRDTPISETAIIGSGIGAAATGLRPVVEIMFAEFMGVAFDQIVTEAAKMNYFSGGRVPMPLVIRVSAGAGNSFGGQHSQTLESWFMNTPGLLVVSPATPATAYGLLRAALREDNPVVFIEPRALYGLKEDFEPGEAAVLALGRARTVRAGSDLTVVALGRMVAVATAAAETLGAEGISCEVIDLMTVLPWDHEAVSASVGRTGRLLTVEENPFTGGWGTDIASFAAGACFSSLRAPIVRVTCPDAPVPHSPVLEQAYVPGARDVADAARDLVRSGTSRAPRWTGWGAEGRRPASPSPAASVLRERRAALRVGPLEQLDRMLEIRAVEDAIQELFLEGIVAGTTHTCQGQEAVTVGLASVTGPNDIVCATYRGHGAALALGMTPEVVLGEVLGRQIGCLGGLGGSMHLVAPEVGLVPTFAIVGAGLPIAAGAAYSAQARGDSQVAVAMFGDGATNIGAFHESLNLAAVWRLPIVFVCENNLYGEYSPIGTTTPVADLAVRAGSYAMPSEIVDGQDLDAVVTALRAAVDRARAGGGPTLVEMKTYRYVGHSRSDPAEYRPPGELERWKERDPIALLEAKLRKDGRATEAALAEVRARVRDRVAAAVAAAKASPQPELADMLEHVLA